MNASIKINDNFEKTKRISLWMTSDFIAAVCIVLQRPLLVIQTHNCNNLMPTAEISWPHSSSNAPVMLCHIIFIAVSSLIEKVRMLSILRTTGWGETQLCESEKEHHLWSFFFFFWIINALVVLSLDGSCI